jgi:CHAD domain-containing protein
MGSVSVSRSIEIERKYAVTDRAALPALQQLDGIASADPQPVVVLEAVYVDTPDRVLLEAGIAVRRRTGGHDAGWHVKLRGTTGRVELHAPIDRADPEAFPAEFALALRSRVRGRPLVPLARIRTERHAVLVSDGSGAGVEVVDDHVTAADVAAGVLRSWREWEAEQSHDSAACAALLERVHVALLEAGAVPSASPAKIAQALGLVGRERPRGPRTAGTVLAALIAGHAEELHRGMQSLALDGDPDGATVHGMRKTIRRARSVLSLERVAGPSGRRLRDRLGDLAGLLGAVRDPLVQAGIAEALLADLPRGTPGLEAAMTVLVAEPRAALRPATAELVERLGAPDVLSVLADLEAFDPDGPLVGEKPKALGGLAARVVRRAGRRAASAVGGDLDAMHAGRKAAKRARFVVEEVVAAGVVADSSKLARAARRDEHAQDVLGDHRDLALVLDALPEVSARLTAAGANAYALGIVAERGSRRLAGLRREAERAIRRLA